MSEKQYADRDAWEMDKAGGYYMRHVQAMTAESLHSKADIAAELAYRDMHIALALWALTNGPVWLGRSIKRTPAGEYVAIYIPRPYAADEIIESTYHADPWECLKLAHQYFKADGEVNG